MYRNQQVRRAELARGVDRYRQPRPNDCGSPGYVLPHRPLRSVSCRPRAVVSHRPGRPAGSAANVMAIRDRETTRQATNRKKESGISPLRASEKISGSETENVSETAESS